MNLQLTLYGTSACHLCEEALAIVLPVTQALGLILNLIDIAGDDALEARYGLSIPVLSSPREGELCWPFDTDKVSAFINRHKN
jgi:hypothetical protein